ncbi:MAG: hypothetical protein IPK42_11415 [Betaproteobacteria bacterium]|nr:hypothetical protein [Betaproteobacteria bacterium]
MAAGLGMALEFARRSSNALRAAREWPRFNMDSLYLLILALVGLVRAILAVSGWASYGGQSE